MFSPCQANKYLYIYKLSLDDPVRELLTALSDNRKRQQEQSSSSQWIIDVYCNRLSITSGNGVWLISFVLLVA